MKKRFFHSFSRTMAAVSLLATLNSRAVEPVNLSAATATATPVAAPSPASPVAKPSATPRQPRTEQDAVTPAIKDPKRHQQFLDRKKMGPTDLLFLGDSITDFWNRIGEFHWMKFAPYSPANFGISGDRTEHVLWRITTGGELEGLEPKVTVIMIGTNNVGHFPDEKPEWTAAGVKKILEIVHEKLPKTKVLLLAVFPRGMKDSAERQAVEALNKSIAGYADGAQTRWLDFNAKFLDENGELPADVMPDKLHPNAKGYQIWYEAMQPTLDEMMK